MCINMHTQSWEAPIDNRGGGEYSQNSIMQHRQLESLYFVKNCYSGEIQTIPGRNEPDLLTYPKKLFWRFLHLSPWRESPYLTFKATFGDKSRCCRLCSTCKQFLPETLDSQWNTQCWGKALAVQFDWQATQIFLNDDPTLAQRAFENWTYFALDLHVLTSWASRTIDELFAVLVGTGFWTHLPRSAG